MVCDSQTAADIAEAMREGGGDDDEEGESEDEDEDDGLDVEGSRLASNGLQTKRRKQHSFYFTLELLLHLQHLIPCPILPTINHVDKCC
jgi:hypothetical protein